MPHRSSSQRARVLPEEQAVRWAAELEKWAFVREKVLEQLDIDSAKHARTLARDIKKLGRAVADARRADEGDRDGTMRELASMLAEMIVLASRLIGPLPERKRTPARGKTPAPRPKTELARIELTKRPKRGVTPTRRKPTPSS